VEKVAKDRDGNEKKKKILVDCPAKTNGSNTPGRRHHCDKEKVKYKHTPGYIIVFLGILILNGAHFGSTRRDARKMWRRAPHGISLPYVRNAMSRNAFEFMRRNIHFADNATQKAQGELGYDPLFKVSYPLGVIMKGMRSAWTPGQHVTINESMIRYMGRAVSHVQYMPAKPIKHGIKVFTICCAVSAVLLGFKIYVGKEDDADNTALGICDQLCVDAGLTGQKGRTLYTYNYYTSMALAKHMFEKYQWTIVGTITLTDKKSRSDHDIPFLKLSNGTRNTVERVWFHEAAIELKTKHGKKYYIQCTTWRDNKQVCCMLPELE